MMEGPTSISSNGFIVHSAYDEGRTMSVYSVTQRQRIWTVDGNDAIGDVQDGGWIHDQIYVVDPAGRLVVVDSSGIWVWGSSDTFRFFLGFVFSASPRVPS